jgi:uncharacterized protein (TIGR03118 family)
MKSVLLRTLLVSAVAVSTAAAGTIGFTLTTLATNTTDPQLINPWGIASSATSPLWIGSNGAGVSEVYTGAGAKLGLEVTLPGDGSVTGLAFNGTTGFNGDNFLFVAEDGTVSGWRGALGTTAETLAAGSAANVYKGLTTATIAGNTYAYLANFRNDSVDVMKGSGGAPNLTGAFTDPGLPAGYASFDIQDLNGAIYVTYALQDSAKHDEIDGAGFGFIDEYDLNGDFIQRLVSQGFLNAPWGMAIAPVGFGDLGGDLLVGNFGDGTINAYNLATGAYLETLLAGNTANPLTIDGLWGLRFGNGGSGGSALSLYVTAGPGGETGGLLGEVNPVPEPGTWLLVALGLVTAIALRRLHPNQSRDR